MPPYDYLAIGGSLYRNYVHRHVKVHLLRFSPTEAFRDVPKDVLNIKIRVVNLRRRKHISFVEDARMETQSISRIKSSLPRPSLTPMRNSGRYMQKQVLELDVGESHLVRLLPTMPIKVP
jgi:hypothetical protein